MSTEGWRRFKTSTGARYCNTLYKLADLEFGEFVCAIFLSAVYFANFEPHTRL